jgi:hypothetical protein
MSFINGLYVVAKQNKPEPLDYGSLEPYRDINIDTVGEILAVNDKDEYTYKVDNIKVNRLSAAELLYSQQKSVNGTLWVSTTGKVKMLKKESQRYEI